MGFNKKAFLGAKLTPRIEVVPVPDLAAFFPEGEKPLWTVRGLTGQELGRANEAATKNKLIGATLEALSVMAESEQISALKQALGVGKDVPDDIARRIELLTVGSVDPECNQELAVRVCEKFPVEFYALTNKITELTGRGHVEAKKSKPSGETQASAPA